MFADNNLFNPAWTTGSLSAIAPIVQVVGFCAMCLISIGGFFMVILPLMRNVVNGIVVVAPNLCDKIDEAHRNKIGLKQSEGGNQVQMIIGSLSMLVLSFFPNFKALSDFDQGIQDPKSYMMRAIPMMCVYIFIGVFIFQGYPARFAEKFSSAATSLIDMALNNVDPVAWIEKIPTNIARPDFSTGNATDTMGKNTNTLSKSIYSAFTSKYSDMSKDNRIALSHEIEGWANGKLGEITTHSESSKYKLTVETRVMDYDPQLNEKAVWPSGAYDDAEHIYIYQVKAPVTGTFNVGVPGGTDGDYFMCILKFYELADEDSSSNNVKNVATIPYAKLLVDGQNGCTLYLPTETISSGGKNITINGMQGSLEDRKTEPNRGGDCYVYKFTCSANELRNATGGTTTGLSVVDPANRFTTHTITKVEWGTAWRFVPLDTTQFDPWSAGESPKRVTTSESGGTTSGGTATPDN